MMTTSNAIPAPPFGPSRQLWLKMALAVICGPTYWFGLWIILNALASGMGTYWSEAKPVPLQGIRLLVGVSMAFGGSIAMGRFLSSRWRGVGIGIAAVFVALVGFVVAVFVISTQFEYSWDRFNALVYFLGNLLAATMGAAFQIVFLEVVTRDAHGRHTLIGLAVGAFVGIGLSIILGMVGLRLATVSGRVTIYLNSNIPDIFITNLTTLAASSLVWVSAVFFPEMLTRRVGWGGVIVWAGIVVAIFGAVIGLSFAFAG